MTVELIQGLLLAFAIVVILMTPYIRLLGVLGFRKRIRVEGPQSPPIVIPGNAVQRLVHACENPECVFQKHRFLHQVAREADNVSVGCIDRAHHF